MATAAQAQPAGNGKAAADPHAGSHVDPLSDPLSDRWLRVERLPCLLTVEISVPDFTVGDLLHLERGRIVATRWTVGQDIPLRVNGELIAWSEFEVVQNRLAVRLTELA